MGRGWPWPERHRSGHKAYGGDPQIGLCWDSPVLNVSETPAASGCVCMCARMGVWCPPSWCELWLGLLQQLVSPAHQVWGHCWGTNLVQLLGHLVAAHEPLGLPLLSQGLLEAIVQMPPSVRDTREQGVHPSSPHKPGVLWVGDHLSSLLHGHGDRVRPSSLVASCCDCQRSQNHRVSFPFLGRRWQQQSLCTLNEDGSGGSLPDRPGRGGALCCCRMAPAAPVGLCWPSQPGLLLLRAFRASS